jgi:hypothetical protein
MKNIISFSVIDAVFLERSKLLTLVVSDENDVKQCLHFKIDSEAEAKQLLSDYNVNIELAVQRIDAGIRK